MIIDIRSAFEAAAKKYLKCRRRAQVALWLSTFSYFAFLVSLAFPAVYPRSDMLYPSVLLTLLTVAAVAAGFRVRYKILSFHALPSVEMAASVFLGPAVRDLAAFIQHGGKSYKSASLKNLRNAANIIDTWSPSSVDYLTRRFSTTVDDFKEAFRRRLIPAIKSGDPDTTRNIYSLLGSIENGLILGVKPSGLDDWNNSLSSYPLVKPKKLFKWDNSRTIFYHLLYLTSVVVGAYAYYSFLRNTRGPSPDTTTAGYMAVFFGLTPYVTYLIWKYISREQSSKAP